MSSARERRPAPWLFGITVLPYGVYGGFISTDCLSNVIAVTIFAFLTRRKLFAKAEVQTTCETV